MTLTGLLITLLIGAIAAFSLLAALVLAAPEIATKLQALFA